MTGTDTSRRFFRSAGAATFSQVWRVAVTFGITLLLRRFVAPGDWGLYDWVIPVFLVLGGLRDLGLVYHVIRLDPRPYGNLLAVELVWGALLALATFGGADLLGLGFRASHPELVPVLRAMTLFLFFEGLASVPRVYFDAELEVGRTVWPEILRNLVFAVTSVALALAGHGVWSLVVGQVVCTAVYAAHLWWRARGKIPLRFERGRTLTLVLHSLPLGTIWVLAVLIRHVDPFILGLRVDAETIGNYTFAYYLAFLVTLTLVPAVTRVLYPALVAYAAEPDKLLEAYRLATLFVLAFEAPLAFFLFVNPELAVRVMGGGDWVRTPDFLRVLCFAPLIDPFTRLGGEILKVYHRDRLWIAASLLTLVSFAGAGWVLTGRFGAIGMAWANYLPLGGIVLMTWGLYRIAPPEFRALLRDAAFVYAMPVILLAALAAAPERQWLRLGLSLAAMAITFGAYAWRFGRSFRDFFASPAAPPRPR